jgi:hypothetical protein
MKGILGGRSETALEPGEVIQQAGGAQITVLREITLAEALEAGARTNQNITPVPGERWYEVDVDYLTPATRNRN